MRPLLEERFGSAASLHGHGLAAREAMDTAREQCAALVNGTAEEFAEAVDRLGLHEVSYSVGWSNWLDIAPDGVSKASGLALVESELGIDHERTVAAGDGLNDLEMIEWADHSIVMGQAKDELKVLGSVVTDPVEDDGLAVALVDHFDLDPAVLDVAGSRPTGP